MSYNLPEPIQLERIDTIKKNKPDNFFITSGSPEERCKGSILKLSSNYNVDNIFLLRYTNHESIEREKNIEDMKEVLIKFGQTKELLIDEKNPIPRISDIIKLIKEYSNKNSEPRISIDISTFIKWHLLILLKALEKNKLSKNIRFLYTEPEDYVTDLFQPLSFGIRRIFAIPTYSGKYDFSKDSLLVLMLGYEGDRALALLEDTDPNDCLLLIGKPAFHKEWEGRAEKMNTGIINTVGKSKIKYIDSRNSLLIYHQLQKLLTNSKYSKFNQIISPLGTKPQILGLYLYLLTDPQNTIITYGSPLRHNDPFYSYGIGRVWQLPFKRIQKVKENED